MHEEELKDCLKKSGEYFDEALKWHNTKHHYVFVERSWLLIFAFVLIFCLGIVITNIFYMLPLKTSAPFIYYSENIYEDIPIIKSLFKIYKDDKDLQTVVEKYLVSKYVHSWNRSDIESPDFDLMYVKRHSSYSLYSDFITQTANMQLDQWLKIKSISITQNPNTTVKKAEVKLEYDKNPDKTKKVKLNFRAADVLLAHKKIVPLDFTVMSYEEI
jgi:type IV secretion system protein VirB8